MKNSEVRATWAKRFRSQAQCRGLRPQSGRRAVAVSLIALALGTTLGACGGNDSLILVAGERVNSEKLDTDPVSILPPGIIMFGYIDAATMFHSNLGPDVGQVVQTLLPLPPEAGFVPSRDVTRIFAGVYAMQGADFCAVVQGNFDTEAIRRSVDARNVSLAGVPLNKHRYADNDLYTAGSIGFTLLTAHTALSGNEIGMRRALDRIRNGKLTRVVPEWMTNLGRTPGATFSLAGDFSQQSAGAAAVQSMPFLSGAKTIRLLGNFQAPGINFAGTLTFNDEAGADASASAIGTINSISPFISLLSTIGLGITIPPIAVARQGKDVGFTVAVDEGTGRTLLRKGAEVMRSLVQIGNQR